MDLLQKEKKLLLKIGRKKDGVVFLFLVGRKGKTCGVTFLELREGEKK